MQITSPQAVYDPRFGWFRPEGGFNPSSFAVLIDALFHIHTRRRPTTRLSRGAVFAYQFMVDGGSYQQTSRMN